MAEHPAMAAKCTKHQIKIFELIAVRGPCLASQRTLDALHSKGLIEFIEHKEKDRLGTFTFKEPYVPLPIHMQWCEWCAENVDDEV